MLSSLILSGTGTSNTLIHLSFLEVLHLEKAVFSRHYNIFSENIGETPLKINDETFPRCLFTIVIQVRKSGS